MKAESHPQLIGQNYESWGPVVMNEIRPEVFV